MTEITRLAADHYAFHAWKEDSDLFDGNELYLDLDTAKAHAAYDYESYEYGEPDDEDNPDDRPVLTWHEHTNRWSLSDGGKYTGVHVDRRPVYRPATPDEIAAQDEARAARTAAHA